MVAGDSRVDGRRSGKRDSRRPRSRSVRSRSGSIRASSGVRHRGVVVPDRRPSARREPEFVNHVGSEQRLRDRDAGVDADVASGLLLEIPNEFDQLAVDHRRIGPVLVKGRRCRDILRDPVDERRERLDLAARPELRPLVVAAAAEDDRVLCSRSAAARLASTASSQSRRTYPGPRQPRRGTTTRTRRSFARPTPPLVSMILRWLIKPPPRRSRELVTELAQITLDRIRCQTD